MYLLGCKYDKRFIGLFWDINYYWLLDNIDIWVINILVNMSVCIRDNKELNCIVL